MGRMDIFKMASMQPETPPEVEAELVQESVMDTPEPVEEGRYTKAEIKAALPAQLRGKVTDSLMAKLNALSTDPDISDEIRDNFLGFNNVMKEGKFKFEDYLNACSYATYKMMGYTNQQAWGLTFPDKLARMRAENRDDSYISAFVHGYSKGKLVNTIIEQALIPSFVLNVDLHQKALNVCATIMNSEETSPKVRVDAAKAILDATRAPEKSHVQLDVNVKDNSGIDELKGIMQEVADNQIKQIEGGKQTKEIAHQKMFTEEAE